MGFNKPFQAIQQQIEILIQRGMTIDVDAEHYLKHLNYYRLSGYWLPFQQDKITHQFYEKTHFSDVLNLYMFDRDFRLLLLDAIERIEVSVRTQWAYYFSQKYGPHAYLNCHLSNNLQWHAQNLLSLEKERERSDEQFIEHFNNNNDMPPIWAVCEVMSFGLLSRWLKSLKPSCCKNVIGKSYGLDYSVLVSFIEHLAYLRNLCAHHSRVWNRKMTKTMKVPQSKPMNLIKCFNNDNNSVRKIYNTLVMIQYLLNIICPENHFKTRLIKLLSDHKIEYKAMGFPENWKTREIWVTP